MNERTPPFRLGLVTPVFDDWESLSILLHRINGLYRPRPWENASEVWVDAPCFPGVRAEADRQTSYAQKLVTA